MNGKERLAIAVQSIADGHTGVEKGVELLVQIFGDIYDEGRDLVVKSLNPRTTIKEIDEACMKGQIDFKDAVDEIIALNNLELGGEG